MDTRTIGTQGLEMAAIGYGAMGTAIGYGPSDDDESIAAIRQARSLGVTHFDTAEMYGWGTGERLLGRAVAPFRDEITIATKFGFTRSFDLDSRPEHVREVVDQSLRNLGVDVIDLLYQHRPDPAVPIEDVVGTMAEFVTAGKVRFLGLSEADDDTIRRGHAVHPLSALQSEYSIFARGIEAQFALLDELGIGLVAYSPLARGFLTGAAQAPDHMADDDFRRGIGWWAPENFDANVAMVDQLSVIAAAKGATVSQLALAWLLAQGDHIVPIPGSRNPDRVANNVASAGFTLGDDDLDAIGRIAPTGGVGSRQRQR